MTCWVQESQPSAEAHAPPALHLSSDGGIAGHGPASTMAEHPAAPSAEPLPGSQPAAAAVGTAKQPMAEAMPPMANAAGPSALAPAHEQACHQDQAQ